MRNQKLNVYSEGIEFRADMPARLDVACAARVLGFAEHDIPILIRERLLSPLGKPAANAPKFFARVVIEQLACDVDWLNKASITTAKYWKRKRKATGRGNNSSQKGEVPEI
jgi:hypothetical protein